MFVQLVTQCFHLAIRLKQDRVGGVRRLDSARNDRQAADRADRFQQKRIEDTYIRVLAQVFDGMRREQSFLLGLKVFVQAVQLVESDTRSGFSALMRKQGDMPLKTILAKLTNKDVTNE